MTWARASDKCRHGADLLIGLAVVCSACGASDMRLRSWPNEKSDTESFPIDRRIVDPGLKLSLGPRGQVIAASHGDVFVGEFRAWSQLATPESLVSYVSSGATENSVWIYDPGPRMLLIRDQARRWHRTLLPTLVAGYEQTVVGLLDDGTPVLLSTAPDGIHERFSFVWLARAGSAVVLDSLAANSSMIVLRGPGGSSVISKQPWAVLDRAVLSADRRAVLVLKMGRTVGDSADLDVSQYELPSYVPQRRSFRLKRWSLLESEVRDWERKYLASAVVTRLHDAGAAARQLEAQLYRPRYLPLFEASVDLGRGMLLIERPMPLGRREWQVFSPSGQLLRECYPGPSWKLLDSRDENVLWVAFGRNAAAETVYVAPIQHQY